jgi:hypothetical protein
MEYVRSPPIRGSGSFVVLPVPYLDDGATRRLDGVVLDSFVGRRSTSSIADVADLLLWLRSYMGFHVPLVASFPHDCIQRSVRSENACI